MVRRQMRNKKSLNPFFWSQSLFFVFDLRTAQIWLIMMIIIKRDWRKRIILPSWRCFICVIGVKQLCKVKWSQDYKADWIKDSKLSRSVLPLHLSLQLKDDLSTLWQNKMKITQPNFDTIVFNANKPTPAPKCINQKIAKTALWNQ